MCGIVGAVGAINVRNYLVEGLYALDYRGYDSAGVAFIKDGQFYVKKQVGRVEALDNALEKEINAHVGIGHTRWATHGVPSESNCHPHFSSKEEFAIIHNGVIENYRSLKTRLVENGFSFYSETDTEVVANLLEYYYRRNKDVLDAIRRSIDDLKGSFAIAIIHKGEDDRLYFMKRSSPMFVTTVNGSGLLASDGVPMIKYTDKFVDLRDNEYGVLYADKIELYCGYNKIEPHFVRQNPELLNRELGEYPHFMLKEIEETPKIISRLVDNYFDGEKFLFEPKMIDAIRKSDDVIFLACGTSYHAALKGVRYMNYLGKRSEAFIASEWAYFPVFTSKKPVYILISQSGETADLIRCQKIINSRGSVNIAITNTKGSSLDREATFSCLLFAGLEVAVASTKAYSAQVAILAMITGAIERRNNVTQHLNILNQTLEDIIAHRSEIEKMAEDIVKAKSIFFIGRGNDYDAALESSLKMKEITYIHSEAFPGGELKHGPIAIVDKETKLVAFNSDMSTDLVIRNNVSEIETRGAKSFIISYKPLFKEGDAFSINYVKGYLSTIPMVFVAQYLAYYVALHKDVDIDKPRNLAKSVTVE